MRVFNKDEAYLSDKHTIDKLGVDSFALMEDAASSILFSIVKYLNFHSNCLFLIGSGNNGGDGLAVCRRLNNMGYNAEAALICGIDKFKNESLKQLKIYQNHKYPLLYNDNNSFKTDYPTLLNDKIKTADVIVDAILGVGFYGELRADVKPIIAQINKSNAFVISIDLPSGVSADGQFYKDGVKADLTVSVGGFKQSAFIKNSSSFFGENIAVDIGINPPTNIPITRTWGFNDFVGTMHRKNKFDNKKNGGHILIVGGSRYYKGAPILAAKGCLKSGAGLLSLAVPNDIIPAASFAIPEAVYSQNEEEDGFISHVDIPSNADVIACGMGLSRNKKCRQVVKEVIESDKPIVLDADSLYFLDDELISLLKLRTKTTVLTPHPGEMARMCGVPVEEIVKTPFSIAEQKSVELNSYIVLKGHYTILSDCSGNQLVNVSGNASLAKGGSGDVLTGIIAAFLAYNLQNTNNTVDYSAAVQNNHLEFNKDNNFKQLYKTYTECKSKNNDRQFITDNISESNYKSDEFRDMVAIANAVFAHGAAADIALMENDTPLSFSPSEIPNNLNKVFSASYFNCNRQQSFFDFSDYKREY